MPQPKTEKDSESSRGLSALEKLKNSIRRRLPKHNFVRSVSILVGGTAVAQAISMIASPLKTRLFTPEDYGLVAVFASLSALVSINSSLRYELAIPGADSHREAAHLVVLGLLITLGVAFISGLVVLALGDGISLKLGVPLLAKYFWLLPIGILLTGGYNVFNYWGIRLKQFSAIAGTKVKQPLVALAIHLIGYKAGGLALLIGNTAGMGAGTWSLAQHALKRGEFRSIKWSGIKSVMYKYKNFPLFSSWSGLFNTASLQLPPLMFAGIFGSAAAGLYSLAHHVLAMPMSLVGKALGDVFFSNAPAAYRENRLGPLVEKAHNKLARVAMAPAIIVLLEGPRLFAFAFGENWRIAGEMARWMTPWLYMVFITAPLSTLFSVIGKQAQGMAYQAFLLGIRIVAIIAGAWYGSLILAVAFFSVSSALVWIVFLIWIAMLAKSNLSRILAETVKTMLLSSACCVPLVSTKFIESHVEVWLFGLAGSAILTGFYYKGIVKEAYR